MTPEEILENNGYDLDAMNQDNVILFRNPDYADAIVGVSYSGTHVIYDYEKMLDFLVKYENMTYDEAMDFVNYNLSFSCDGNMPIVMYPLEQEVSL